MDPVAAPFRIVNCLKRRQGVLAGRILSGLIDILLPVDRDLLPFSVQPVISLPILLITRLPGRLQMIPRLPA